MGSKILLADDSITIQKVVNLTFSDEGIEVVAVSNGDVAERKLDEVKPDLVLADIFMPGKNGYELCESIKQNPQHRNVPVVLLVGAFEPFDQAEARRVRADAHLTKPFESRTLVETVRRLINASTHTSGGPIAAMTPADDPRDDNGSGRDTGAIAPRLTSSATPKLDLTAMMADTSAPSTASARSTSELSSRIADFHTEAFEVSVAGAPAREAITATLIDTDEPFDTMEFASTELTSDEVASSLAFETKDSILDFERSGFFESPTHHQAHQDDIAFETQPVAAIEVDVNPPMSEGQAFDRNSAEITEFDLPSGVSAWNENANASQSNPQANPFEMNLETAFEVTDENAAASVLGADEPLGDILDEMNPLEQPAPEASADDSLNFEFAEPETVVTPPETHTQFDLIDTPDTTSSPVSTATRASTEAEAPAEEHQVTPPRAADWTSPRAGAYSTAALDSVVMPIETAAYLAQHSLKDSTRSEASQDASFATPARWTEEEARFAAIDIEAVPVDEPIAHRSSEVSDDTQNFVESPAASAAKEPANGKALTSESLSAAAIEEIVRRVIAEMSDSVVREVAWEVVPDCVERVVDQLTRESLSKST